MSHQTDLRCPFCGGPAELGARWGRPTIWVVTCRRCGLRLEDGTTPEAAAERWRQLTHHVAEALDLLEFWVDHGYVDERRALALMAEVGRRV